MKILKLPVGQLVHVFVRIKVHLNLLIQVSEPVILWGKILKLNLKSDLVVALIGWLKQYHIDCRRVFLLDPLEAENCLKADATTWQEVTAAATQFQKGTEIRKMDAILSYKYIFFLLEIIPKTC